MKITLFITIFAITLLLITGCSQSETEKEQETFKPDTFTAPEEVEVIEKTTKETPKIEEVKQILENTTDIKEDSQEEIKQFTPTRDCNPCLDENVKVGEMYVYLSEDGYLCSDENCTCKSTYCEMTNEQSRFNIRDTYNNTINETLKYVKFHPSCYSSANYDLIPNFKFGSDNQGISYSTTASFIGEMKPEGKTSYRWQFSLKSIFDKFPKEGDKTNIHCKITGNSTEHQDLKNQEIDFELRIRGIKE